MKKVEETLNEWEKKRPPETRWADVCRILNRLGFEVPKTKGSIIWIRHDRLAMLDPGYSDLGGFKIHKQHSKGGPREKVNWFDLKKVIRAARIILESEDIEEDQDETHS